MSDDVRGPEPGTERKECWNCGYQRPIYEACPQCGRFGGGER